VLTGISPATQAGMELGLWKFLGTTANLFDLSQTSAGHGAFRIELTSFRVTAAQGFMDVVIPARLWSAIALVLSEVFLFTKILAALAMVVLVLPVLVLVSSFLARPHSVRRGGHFMPHTIRASLDGFNAWHHCSSLRTRSRHRLH
jgi:hypothetical protein